MKVIVSLRLTAATSHCLLALLAALGAEPPDKPTEPGWGAAQEGIRLSLRTKQPCVASGDALEAEIVLQNVDAKPRKVVRRAWVLRSYQLQITGPDGKPVEMSSAGKNTLWRSGSNSSVTLEPKEEMSRDLALGQLFDIKAPGTYKIVATFRVDTLADDSKYVTVTSNTLTVEVKPDEKKDK